MLVVGDGRSIMFPSNCDWKFTKTPSAMQKRSFNLFTKKIHIFSPTQAGQRTI
jgi:hypothetical protein